MPTELISLDEASWRLELSAVSGRVLVELLLTNEPDVLGLFPGKVLRHRGCRVLGADPPAMILSEEKERELIRCAQRGDRAARNRVWWRSTNSPPLRPVGSHGARA